MYQMVPVATIRDHTFAAFDSICKLQCTWPLPYYPGFPHEVRSVAPHVLVPLLGLYHVNLTVPTIWSRSGPESGAFVGAFEDDKSQNILNQ
jgi:hypothetical protein